MNVVHTPNLVLRPMEPADVPAYAELRADPEVVRYLSGGPAQAARAAELAAERIPLFLEHWRRHGYGVWGAFERSGALVGQCGLNFVEQFGEVEVLYALARRAWGRGLATEMARASLDFGFGPAGLRRIIGLVAAENVASCRVLEKLGLGYRHDVSYGGRRVRYYQIDGSRR